MKYPEFIATSNNTFILTKDYSIKGVIIPKGFETDGLTLKIRLLRLLIDKYSPKFSPFFVVHDWFCSKDNYVVADSLGSEILFEIQDSFKTRVMIKAIRIYHKMKYKVHISK